MALLRRTNESRVVRDPKKRKMKTKRREDKKRVIANVCGMCNVKCGTERKRKNEA